MRDALTRRISTVAAMLALPFRAAPGMAAVQSVIMIAPSLAGPAQAFGVRELADSAIGTGSAWQGFWLILGATCASLLFQVAGTALWATLNERMDAYIQQRLLRSTTAVPHVGHHERPDLADRIAMIRGGLMDLQNSVSFVVSGISMLVSGIAVLAVLVSVNPLLLLLVVMAGLRVWASGRSARWVVAAEERVQSMSRLAGQLEEIAASPRHGTEVRVSGLSGVLPGRILRLRAQARRETERAAARGLALMLAIGLGYGLAYGGILIFVIYRAVHGHGAVGDVALVLLLSVQIEGLARGVGGHASGYAATLRIVDHLNWLTRYSREQQVGTSIDQVLPAFEAGPAPEAGIELRHLSFTYPGTGTEALHDINLRLPAGSVVALVGENGAGKSTLVKLLCGLYSPTAGEILVDGRPVHDLATESWRSRITVVFQDAVRYSLPASDAVGIGFLPRRDDERAVRDALSRVDGEGIVDALPHGLATQLGTGFSGGVDLSGGQWQRLALARSAMREDPLLRVLDEPTSAIDPETEQALVRQYARRAAKEAANGTTRGITLLVTHRLSSVRLADLVVTLHQGRIAEMGTQQELLDRGGLFAELFGLQASAYRTEAPTA